MMPGHEHRQAPKMLAGLIEPTIASQRELDGDDCSALGHLDKLRWRQYALGLRWIVKNQRDAGGNFGSGKEKVPPLLKADGLPIGQDDLNGVRAEVNHPFEATQRLAGIG